MPTNLAFGLSHPRLQILLILFCGVIGDRDENLLTRLETKGVLALLTGVDIGSLQGSRLIRPVFDRGLRKEEIETGLGSLCLLHSSGLSNWQWQKEENPLDSMNSSQDRFDF